MGVVILIVQLRLCVQHSSGNVRLKGDKASFFIGLFQQEVDFGYLFTQGERTSGTKVMMGEREAR